jgi:hypothetical protein
MNPSSLAHAFHALAKTQVTLSIVGFVVGAFFWIPAISFYKRAQVTTATVTALTNDKESKEMIAPVFTFKDTSGVERKKASDLYSYPPAFTVGQKISIRFLSGNPDSARPDTFWDLWAVPIIIQGSCVVVFVFSFIGLRVLKRTVPMSS